jgi:chromate transporter
MSPSSEAPTAPAPVSLVQAFGNWLKLGFISFGGPAGQIALMHQDLVERKRWISERRFLHALNFCMLLPGPEAQQLATYIGWLMHRTWGGIIAGTLFVLPSLLILIGLSWLYLSFGQTFWATALLHGVKPAVTAIVLAAAYRIGQLRRHLFPRIAVPPDRARRGAARRPGRQDRTGGVSGGRHPQSGGVIRRPGALA